MNSKEHFERDLEQVIRRAKAQQVETLFSYSLFGEDGFAYQQQGLIVETYTDIYLNAELHPEIAHGWDQFFAFDTVNLFLLLLIIAGVLAALLPEAGSTAPLVRSTKHGRGRTGLCKLIVLLLFSVGSTLLLLLSTYLGVLLKCGELSSLSNSIAVFAGYGMVPLCVSVGEYLGLLVLSKLLLGCGVAMLCTFLCLLLRNLLLGCISTIGVAALSALLYGLLPLDAGRFLNLYGVSRFVQLTEAFRCIDLFGYAVLLIPVALAMIALLGLFAASAAFCCTDVQARCFR